MNKKYLWIIIGIIAVLIPIITVLCFNAFVFEDKKMELVPVTVLNGGTICPADEVAAKVAMDEDGKTVADAVYKYVSPNGFELQYNAKYATDFSGSKYDFFISNESKNVTVAVQAIPYDEAINEITTKEQWDEKMGQGPEGMGECAEFNRTTFNGMEVLVANYRVTNEEENLSADLLVAVFIGDEVMYNYIYTAALNASEKEAQQIGGILYTIKEEM